MLKSKNKSANRAKYHSYETFPAKVLFDIRETKNYQLMRPKPGTSTEWLKATFDFVYDEYFVKIENEDANRYVELVNIIGLMTYKKVTIRAILAFIYTIPTEVSTHPEIEKMIREQLDELNKHLEEPIDFDIDFVDELMRVLNVEIGIIKDEIEISEQELEILKVKDDNRVYNFYRELALLEEVHGRTQDEKMLLPMYVERVKLAVEKNNRLKLKN